MLTAQLVMIVLLSVPIMVLQICIPYLTRSTISFGVTVSSETYHSEPVVKLRKRFVLTTTISYALLIAILLILYGVQGGFQEDQYPFLLGNIVILSVVVSIGINLYFNAQMKKLRPLFEQHGTEGKATFIIDTNFHKQRLVLSTKWYLIQAVVIAGSVWFALSHYNQFPAHLPLQYDLQGELSRTEAKSYFAVLGPNMIQVLLTLLLLSTNVVIQRSKQQLDPSNPDLSLRRSIVFRRRWSLFNFLCCLALVCLFLFIQMSMLYTFDPVTIMYVSLGFPLHMVAGAIYLSFTTGQSGSRLLRSDSNSAVKPNAPVHNDHYWKFGGSLYYNPGDPSIFIEKRMGIGWTVNFARPTAWAFFIAPIVILAALRIFKVI